MAHATAPARLAGFGRLHPDGSTSFRLADPISLAEFRALAAQDWVSAITTTDNPSGRTAFRCIATVNGRQFTVTGHLRTGR
ncbi:hypothetical protein ACH4E7_43775 [Kitasatospora sp. NPDC018058]|jgi:hypothetical protein|uniref:hypothetical protein n=1 Tax=Kitasatospora sp. NPDC018058 TaxID=3364025 RepID=UPI0037C0CFA4